MMQRMLVAAELVVVPGLGRGAGGGGHRRQFRGWPGVPGRSPGRSVV